MYKFYIKMELINILQECFTFILTISPNRNSIEAMRKVYTLVSPKNYPSILSIYMQAYFGAHLVPIAVPEECCLMWPLNSKKLLFNINAAI